MIRKKWRDSEPVLSVETEDEFWKALRTGEAVELTGELGEKRLQASQACSPAVGTLPATNRPNPISRQPCAGEPVRRTPRRSTF